MKKLIILISILCIVTQSVWAQECLSKEALQLAQDTGISPQGWAAHILMYEGKLNGDMLGLLTELKSRVEGGDLDNDKLYTMMKEASIALNNLFSIVMSPDELRVTDKAPHFEKYFGSKWGPVALKLHNEKGDMGPVILQEEEYNNILASLDDNGCLKQP